MTTVPVSWVPSGSTSLCSGENRGAVTTAWTVSPCFAEAESKAVSSRTRATLSGRGSSAAAHCLGFRFGEAGRDGPGRGDGASVFPGAQTGASRGRPTDRHCGPGKESTILSSGRPASVQLPEGGFAPGDRQSEARGAHENASLGSRSRGKRYGSHQGRRGRWCPGEGIENTLHRTRDFAHAGQPGWG